MDSMDFINNLISEVHEGKITLEAAKKQAYKHQKDAIKEGVRTNPKFWVGYVESEVENARAYILGLYTEVHGGNSEGFDDWRSYFASDKEAEEAIEFERYKMDAKNEELNPILF